MSAPTTGTTPPPEAAGATGQTTAGEAGSPRGRAVGALALAADIGGTFTDVVLADAAGGLWTTKCPTTADPIDGLIAGARQVLDRAGGRPADVARVVHGTTLATNVILERRGAPVAFLTTAGFGSLLELGRQARVEEERHDLFWSPTPSPVPPERTFEVPERIGPRGEVVRPLDEEAAARIVDSVAALDVAAVAICLLHAYANPDHERRLAELCRRRLPGVLVVCSTDVLPQAREHDRAVTTVMSATVGPVMSAYLRRLEGRLRDLGITAPLHVMGSSGDVLSAELAARRAVATVESGPAAGVMAVREIGSALGLPDTLALDMGGTTAKAAVVRDGRPGITPSFSLGGRMSAGGRGGGLTIALPAVDLAEVGAGGGSIAWVDAGGALRLGPRSAGAEPGPACYGRGGTEPTVTDANLVLGYLAADGFTSGGLALDRDRAVAALRSGVAEPLGVDVVAAAAAVHELANAAMASAVHVVSVQRGVDPRRFALVVLGGAGPVHAARLAERFGIRTVVVPQAAGVGSAVGLLECELGHERAATAPAPGRPGGLGESGEPGAGFPGPALTRAADPDAVEAALAQLAADAAAELGVAVADVRVERAADLRYRGQATEVSLPVPAGPVTAATLAELEAAFHRYQRDTYGIVLEDPTELVTLRARVTVPAARPSAPGGPDVGDVRAPATPAGTRRVHLGGPAPSGTGRDDANEGAGDGFTAVPVFRREQLRPGDELAGPALVVAPDTTALVPPGWTAAVHAHGHLILEALTLEAR
ncbi:MAG TPA: hydantoinase/oxoprolinase family protein [Acidimicrobiales bacterium]